MPLRLRPVSTPADTPNRVAIFGPTGLLDASSVTSTELAALAGLSGDILTTTNAKTVSGKTLAQDVVFDANNTRDIGSSGVKAKDAYLAGQVNAGSVVTTGDVTVGGNLTVQGTTTTLNTATLEVEDKNILVNNGGNDASSEGAGLEVERTGTNGSLIYANASATKFRAGDLGTEVDLVGTSSSQALTNKTLVVASNTVTTAASGNLAATELNAALAELQGDIDNRQPLDGDLTAIAGLATNGLIAKTGVGTAATRTITAPAAGITISDGDGVAGNPTLALANDLAAIEGLSTTGIVARTGDGTAATRSIAQPAAGITVSNADGVSGNPTLALANDLAALEGLSGTGIVARTGSETYSERTIAAGSTKISVSNGNGVSGNPTIDVAEANLTLGNIGGTVGTTQVANDAVDNTKLSNMTAPAFKGRITAGAGDPEDLSATQATSMLNDFVGDSGAGGTKGLVPAPAAGDAAANKFLKANGNWTTVTSGTTSPLTTKGDIWGYSTVDARIPVGSNDQVLTADSTQTLGVKWASVAAGSQDSPYELTNLGLSASVGSNAITIALKQKDGSTDPASGSGAVKIGFRNATVTTGGYVQRSVTSSLSVVVSSGSTLGSTNGNPNWIYVYAIDNAGTVELAVAGSKFVDDGSVVSTTAEGGAGAADSKHTLYSTTARSNVAVRLLGRVKSTQTTAGTWATSPSEVTISPFESKAPRSTVRLNTPNGFGSTNNKIRRFTTTVESFGDAITYTDSASNGASFTINEDGVYSMSFTDRYSAGTAYPGISKNSSQLTTHISSITAADRLGYQEQGTATQVAFGTFATTVVLLAGDTIRPHTSGLEDAADGRGQFTITKVG